MNREHPGLCGSDHSPDGQTQALHAGEIPAAVYGLEKMGLPLATVYARATSNVTNVDISEDMIGGINDDGCHVMREPGLSELVAEQAERGALRATTDGVATAEGATVHVIIVSTPLTGDHEPDLAVFETVLDSIVRGLAPSDLVVVECVVPPGTNKDLVIPHLAGRSGLSAGKLGVTSYPERTSSGRALRDITKPHLKIVGGVGAEDTRVAALVYGEITANEAIPIHDVTTAEVVKLFEGVYRDVNIALASELTRLRDDLGIDMTEAINAANTQPYCDIHALGPGVSGYCIPWCPYFITSRVTAETPLLLTAHEVNNSMPAFAAGKFRDELAAAGREIRGATIAILGIAYRPDIAETCTTPAAGVIDRLSDFGATVLAVDPMLSGKIVASFGVIPISLSDLPNRAIDVAVAIASYEEFDGIDWAAFDNLVVVDGCDTLGDIDHRVYEIDDGPRGRSSETEAGPEIVADSSHGGPDR